jgi:hypothetical protein
MTVSFVRGENPLRADKLNEAFDERVGRLGDSMLGPLRLYRDPVYSNESATKQYVDMSIGGINIQWNAGTVSGLGTHMTLSAGILDATGFMPLTHNAARMQVEWPVGSVVTNGTVYPCFDAPFDGVINSMTHFCNTGSFTVAIQINGVTVTGLGAVSPTSVVTTTNATAARTFSAGQRISAIITGASVTAADALLSLNVSWSN